ncbi:uncharacterized protein CDAR_265761 [Caerostris darwini]|uniref:Reverse transcriptase domain-containing protein n=1 Tax=Caerostris darwini TaxID=1538125 RepID=A0AAV4V7N7_9ARAC|nr:uncharacterized protein CDAR_265761 [Caerostris darwini]
MTLLVQSNQGVIQLSVSKHASLQERRTYSPSYLMHLGSITFDSILRLLNKIWSSEYLLSYWYKYTVLQIYKKDKVPGEVQSYRRISLTSNFCKILRIIISRLNWSLETRGIYEEEQAGFRRFKFTQHPVALLSHFIKDTLDNKHILSAVFVDFISVYDLARKEIRRNSETI